MDKYSTRIKQDNEDERATFTYKEILLLVMAGYREILLKVMPVLVSIVVLSLLLKLYLI